MNSFIVFIAQDLAYIIAGTALVYWCFLPKKQKIELLIAGVVIAITAYSLAKVGGMLFYNPRPFTASGVTPLFYHIANNGFPSSHTLFTAVVAAAVLYTSRRWGIGFLFLAALVGTSRVLANVHHVVDIVGSFVFVAVGFGVAYYVVPKVISYLAKTSWGKHCGLETPVHPPERSVQDSQNE